MTKEEAEKKLKQLQENLNALSDDNAIGTAELSLKKNENSGKWSVKATGELCSGTDNDGTPYWRQVDELLNGDDYWESDNLSKLIKTVENAINNGNTPADND